MAFWGYQARAQGFRARSQGSGSGLENLKPELPQARASRPSRALNITSLAPLLLRDIFVSHNYSYCKQMIRISMRMLAITPIQPFFPNHVPCFTASESVLSFPAK